MKRSVIYAVANTLYLMLPVQCKNLCNRPRGTDKICDLVDKILVIANIIKTNNYFYNY